MERCHRAPQEHRASTVGSPVRLEAATMGRAFTRILVVLGVIQFALLVDDQTAELTEKHPRQHEEQRSLEMAWLQEMEQRSLELPEVTQRSLLLLACQCSWFWSAMEMLLMLFSFYWWPRKGSSGYDSSACGETPAEPSRKRRRRRRRRKKMRGIADYGDKLDQTTSPDQCLEWKDMQNLKEEGMKGVINASAKPFPQKLLDRAASREYISIHS